VLNPGWGDAVQAAKAGLLEIADVFVLNKADRPGAGEAERDLVAMLGVADRRDSEWIPPVVRTVATSGEGAGEVVDAVRRHRDHLEAVGLLARRRGERAAAEVRGILVARLLDRLGAMEGDPRFDDLAAQVAARQLDPWTATDRLLGSSG
jgi:LAO/AO transport system kinase